MGGLSTSLDLSMCLWPIKYSISYFSSGHAQSVVTKVVVLFELDRRLIPKNLMPIPRVMPVSLGRKCFPQFHGAVPLPKPEQFFFRSAHESSHVGITFGVVIAYEGLANPQRRVVLHKPDRGRFSFVVAHERASLIPSQLRILGGNSLVQRDILSTDRVDHNPDHIDAPSLAHGSGSRLTPLWRPTGLLRLDHQAVLEQRTKDALLVDPQATIYLNGKHGVLSCTL